MSVPAVFDRRLQRLRLARAIAGGYADFLVARVAQDLGDRLAAVLRPFGLGLDLGAPTGHVAAALAASGQVGRVVRAGPLPATGLACVADEEALPFAAGSFDLVASALALHGVNDLPGALLQIRQALKPDGLFLGCLFAGDTLFELRRSLIAAETEIEGGASPRVAPFADLRDLGALMQRAGFALPVVDLERVTVRYADPLALMRDLRAMGLTNTLVQRRRVPLARRTLIGALAHYAEQFADADGRVRASFDVAWLSGWAPHASQQRPLRPGSAKARLADALAGIAAEGGGSKD